MTTPIIIAPPNTPLRAQAARKRYAADRLAAKAAALIAAAEALEAEADRRKRAAAGDDTPTMAPWISGRGDRL